MKLSTALVIILCVASLLSSVSCRRRRKRPGMFSRYRRVRPNASKSVYYYAVPRTTVKPRIRDNLDFKDIGIHEQVEQQEAYAPVYDDNQSYDPSPQGYATRPNPPVHHRQKKYKPKGPGYRLKGPLSTHYVVNNYNPKPASSPLSDSLSSAAKEMRNAYKTALIHSAKIAHFTTSAGSKYFQGIRNILYKGRPSDRNDNTEAATSDVELPSITSDSEDSGSSSILPSVHVDWGSSFWNLFYNKKELNN